METNLGYSQAGLHSSTAASYRRYILGKRALDLAICLAILPLALLLMPALALAITLDSRGPVFFVQPRVGQYGRTFHMIKFRTMRRDYDSAADREAMQTYIAGGTASGADAAGAHLYKPQDARASVTRVGRILRRTSLDELPQIINVLRGEMSIVGPRPNVPWEVEKYAQWHRRRLATRPGITGLAQIHGRSSLPFDTIVRYDIEYVERQCLRLDLSILWRTAKAVLTGNGAG